MTVERKAPPRVFVPVRRGGHASGVWQRREFGERARIALFVTAAVALALILTAAFIPSRGGKSRLLPPVQAAISAPPLVPAPRSPTASPVAPDEPPGFPSSIPAADPPERTQSAPAPVVVRTVSYEAESAVNTLFGETHIRPAPAGSGGQAIGAIGGDAANRLRFNRIVVPVTGVYTVAIHYLSAEDRSLAIGVNNRSPVSVRFAGTGVDFDTVGSLTLRVTLVEGANTMEFGNPVARGPDLDRIIVGG